MKLITNYKENECFEKKLKEKYPENISTIIMEWLEDGLAYVMKETSNENIFILGNIDRNNGSIEYTENEYTIEDVIGCIISEMEFALDDNGSESRETIQEEYDLLNKVIC